MKNFLLMAVAALVAVSANAQLTKKVSSRKAQHQTSVRPSQQVKLAKKDLVMPMQTFGVLSENLYGANVKLNKQARGAKSLKEGRLSLKLASKRAGAVQESYDAYGTDNDEGAVTWTMKTATEDGTLLMGDVIPTITDGIIAVEYTLSGNTITIAPQFVGSIEHEGVPDYIFLFGASSENGSITMTLNDDNSISTDDDILYGGFVEQKFTPITSDDFQNKYTGYYEYVSKISYLVHGQVKAPYAQYEPDGLYLHVNFSPSWFAHQTTSFMYLPVDVTSNFLNYTQDTADTWSWSMSKLKDNAAGDGYEVGEELTASTASFSVTPAPNDIYYPPVLKASLRGAESAPYQWSLRRNKTEAYVLGGGDMTWNMSDGTTAQINKCDPANRVTTAGYLATPDINTNSYNFSTLIFYQGKPAAPIYFEGISLWVGAFAKNSDLALKCKIQKVTRDPETLRITLGDVIAEADLDTNDLFLDEEDASDVWAQLNWNNFYVEDEEGLSEVVDYIQVADEFAIVFEGWNNGSFSAMPVIEYSGDIVNTASTTSLYVQQPGNESVLGFFQNYCKPYVSYKSAMYGWLHTTDNKDIILPTEGGSAKIHVEPYTYANDDEGNPTTALWLADDSDQPDWLQFAISNEVYTSEEFGFDMVFSAEALPEGVDGRQAHLIFEQWGAKLEVTVTQGEVAGITVTKAEVKSGNAQMYNVAGQRVNKGYKGLVIKNGKKMLNK